MNCPGRRPSVVQSTTSAAETSVAVLPDTVNVRSVSPIRMPATCRLALVGGVSATSVLATCTVVSVDATSTFSSWKPLFAAFAYPLPKTNVRPAEATKTILPASKALAASMVKSSVVATAGGGMVPVPSFRSNSTLAYSAKTKPSAKSSNACIVKSASNSTALSRLVTVPFFRPRCCAIGRRETVVMEAPYALMLFGSSSRHSGEPGRTPIDVSIVYCKVALLVNTRAIIWLPCLSARQFSCYFVVE